MLKLSLAAATILGLSATPTWAEATMDALAAIDSTKTQCQEKTGADLGQQDCLRVAEHDYDVTLNKVFKSLMDALDPNSSKILRDAQRLWLAAREADRKVWNGPWRVGAGTLTAVIEGTIEADRTRQRVEELSKLLFSVRDTH